MDPPQPQSTRIHADSNHDYLTNLPPNVKDNILVKLPIKEAVRTSILSTKWLDLWVSIPYLVFKQKRHTESELIKMVDMVLLLHQGPIKKFKLLSSCGFTEACSDAIHRWLLILSRNGIKDLEIKFLVNDGFKIPFRLISCTVLERLSLSGCCINIPSFSQGFKQLRTLMLTHCKTSGNILENMDSNCPLLDHLVLHFLQQDCLRICASNLTSLDIVDIFHDICLETPKLASACIHLVTTPKHHQKKESNIICALGRLTNIRTLEISGEFLQYLATEPIPENLPAIFNHLTDISVTLQIKRNVIASALCLFENAPNLEKLHIQLFNNDQPDVETAWVSKAIEHRLFKHLKVVKLKIRCSYDNFSLQNTKILLEFAKLVLSTTPVLEKLNFIGFKAAMDILEMLKWFPKLSKDVDIAFS